MVIGKTIHLHGVSAQAFLKDERWVRHELVHIRQTKERGVVRFLSSYLYESWRFGYYANRYEREAREGEHLPVNFEEFLFLDARTGEQL